MENDIFNVSNENSTQLISHYHTNNHSLLTANVPVLTPTEEIISHQEELQHHNTDNHSFLTSNAALLTPTEEKISEQVAYTVFIVSSSMWIYGCNSLLITVIYRDLSLHTPAMLLRCTIALLDVLICTCSQIIGVLTLFLGHDTPYVVCMIFSTATIGFVFVNMFMTSLLAVERYLYIVHPLRHTVLITNRNLIAAIAVIVTIVLIYLIVTEIRDGRSLLLSMLSCQLKSGSVVAMVFFVLPPFVVTVYVLVQLVRLKIRLSNTVSVTVPYFTQQQQHTANCLTSRLMVSKQSLVKNLKMVTLVSGSLWLTAIPAYAVRLLILVKWPWEELETRSNMAAFTVMRITNLVMTLVSSGLNPVIQFYMEEPLRIGMKRLLQPIREGITKIR